MEIFRTGGARKPREQSGWKQTGRIEGVGVDRTPVLGQHDVPVIAPYLKSIKTPIVVFVNPLAGSGQTGSYLMRIRKVFEDAEVKAEFAVTESAEDLEGRARTAIDRGTRVLMTMGGDGTFQGLANAAFGSDVVLGLLPTGGGNDFARAIGLPKEPVAAARAVLAGQPRPVDLLRAKTEDGHDRLYVAGGGLGLDVDVARHAAGTYRRWPGRLRYVASLVRALRGFTALHVRAQFPEGEAAPTQGRVLVAGVLNTASYGSGVRLSPDAKMDDGWLNIALVDDLNKWKALTLLPRLLWNGELPNSLVRRIRARKVLLLTDRPCFFHGDGEILGPAPVEIEVAPKAAQVLAPMVRSMRRT